MQLLHFDRSGPMASKPLDITSHTTIFVWCLLAVFLHKPGRLAGKDAPFQTHDSDNRLLQVVTAGE